MLSALEGVRRVPASGCAHVAGLAGIGKTTLLNSAVDVARATGWVALTTGCHLVQDRIPLAAVGRLFRNAAAELGERAETYLPKSARAPGSAALEESFYRLLEGVLIDYPVLLAVDDVQWLDVESERVLGRALQLYQDRPLALLVSERGREIKRFARLRPRKILLEELEGAAIAELVRSVYPEANAAVVDTIARRARGHPLTAAVLADAAGEARAADAESVPASIRSVVAHRVEALNPQEREFVQICSLVDEPIETDILAKLFPGASLPKLANRLERRFFVSSGEGLRFGHVAIAEAVRQTLPVDVPFRKRILAALQAFERPTLERYERIARQAAACSERGVGRDALLALAREALGEQAWITAADAFMRAFAIAQPADEDFARSYSSYAAALIANDEPLRARSVLEAALDVAGKLRLERGFGELAALYMSAMWYDEDFATIPEVFAKYVAAAITAEDRLAMYATLAFDRAVTLDVAGFEAAKSKALSQPGGSPQWVQRVHVAEALLQSRLGHRSVAVAAVAEAWKQSDRRQHGRVAILGTTAMLVDHLELGVNAVVAYLAAMPPSDDENTLIYDRFLHGYAALAQGNLDQAELIVEEALMRRVDRNARRLLSITAAVSALRRERSPHAELIEEEMRAPIGDSAESIVPLAAWWAASLGSADGRTREVVRKVIARARHGLQPPSLFDPLPLVLYAERAQDEEVTLLLADGEIFDALTPWHKVQRDAVRGIARAVLRRPGAASELESAALEFERLGAPLYAAIVAARAGTPPPRLQTVLTAAGISDEPDPTRPTPREAQIATLQSLGRSSQEIATELSLSERVVAYHLERLRTKALVKARA